MSPPTLYEWIGGQEVLSKLTAVFYQKVRQDELLAPIFSGMSDEHPAHVAAFIGEVLGGPKTYTREHGGHPEMIRHHLDRHLTEQQRRRWINLLLDAYEEVSGPDDPEFASAFISYLEWGTRLAVLNSQTDAKVFEDAPMPSWGWGEVGGPYEP